jgi:hypothetical protein
MKNVFSIFLLIFLSIYNVSIGQDLNSTDLTPNGRLDNVFDRYGKKIPLSDLLIDKKGGGTKSVGPLCSSGYFDLYFEVGSGMEGNSPVELARRAVVCQVFSDLSQFIETPNPSIHVNILIKNINTELSGFNPTTNPNPAAFSNVLGLATSYYVLPSLGPNIIGGIADNEIWKTINSGIDSYTNVASPLSSTSSSNNGSGYYHGMVALNFNNPSINWHLDLSQSTNNGLYDLYSVILHEVTHALGFASLIDVNGNSKFGTNFPYYSRYDLFLKSPSNQPLITNSGNCSLYNYGFNPSLNTSILTPSTFSCSSHVKFGGSINQATYTPTIFANESSLSHLEDQCHLPNNYANDEYYVMSNANGSGPFYMKRYLKPEERSVLCDIGYKVNPNFGNLANLNFYNYGSTVCPGKDIVGINDGIAPNGSYQYVTTINNSANPLIVNNFLSNDYNTNSYECLTDIYGNGIPTPISSTSFSYSATSPGIAVLRYVPISPTGVRGNITYIYIYISANNCTPSTCVFINNSEFENGSSCGQINSSQGSTICTLGCWEPFTNTPDVYKRNCTLNNTTNLFNIPSNFFSNPATETWNGSPNNTIVGIASTGGLGTPHWNESIQTQLNSPLIPGHTYTINLKVKSANSCYTFGAPLLPSNAFCKLIIGGTAISNIFIGGPQTSLPTNLYQLGNEFSIANDNNWHNLTQTFQYNGQFILNNFVVYNSSNMNTLVNQPYTYLYIDDVQLSEVVPNLNLNLPTVLCLNQTINDLSIYAPIPGGTFSGPGVTTNGNISSFNPQITGAGNHTISYSYTNNINCLVTISQQIVVVNSTFTTSINASNTQICSGQPVTLTAISSSPATYTWNPGNLTGASINPIINASSLFTLTATNSQGCIASSTVNINVLPSSLNVTPSSSTICSGQSVALAATGFNTYSWTPANGLSTTSGGIVTASPTISTTYFVTGTSTNGCVSTVAIPITVIPLPNIQITPSNPSICSGLSVALTATGATSYIWSPSQGLSSTTGAIVIATPSVTTIYNVAGQNDQGCFANQSVTVTVNPTPIISITSTNNIICTGQQVNLTASGALNYSWSPSIGLSSTSGSTVAASPISTTNYVVNGTNAVGCSATSSINLIVNPCNDCLGGTLLSGTITSSPSIGATLRIANDITISGNITFSANNVKIMPGVTINVTSNSTLTINGSHFYGCENMWKGIKVQAGGKVILQPYIVANVIQKTALIEDAIIGIDYLPITTQQNVFVLSSNNATFNKNGTAIRLQSYLFNNVSSVFEVKNSLFTSRNLYSTVNSTWPLTSTVKAASTSVNPLISPYIPNSYSLSNLKYPMNTIRAQIGLDLNDIGKTIITTPIVYNSLVIGSTIATEYIVFDNLKVGIYSFNSNVKIQNTIMQITENLSINSFNSTPIGTPALGTGIFSKSDNLHINKLEVAGSSSLPNQFYGLSTAVFTDNIKDVQCYYNTIRSNRSNMPNYLTLSNGERGIYIREVNKLVNIQVNYNTFYSINKGMSLIADVAGTAPTVNILNNIFKKSSTELSGIVLSSYAVLLDNSNSTNLMAGGNIRVNNNTIFNTISGIKLNSWKRITQQINNNSITFGNNSTVDMFGIKLVNSLMGAINTQIYNNSVIGAVAYNSQNSQYRAIAIEASIGNDLKCNDVRNAYSGLYFSSNCNPSKTSNNTMTNHKYGFVLDNNGIIGQQGSSTVPADNVWSGSTWDATGTANGRFKNACLNISSTLNSIMFVRSGANSYNPSGSSTTIPLNYPYTNTLTPNTILFVNNASAPTACAISSAPPINALMTTDVVNALETTVAYITDTTILASDAILLTDQVYRTLDSDTSIMQNSIILTDFYDSTAIKDIGILLNVEVALAKDSTQIATTLNDLVIPDNQVEESYRIYYESYINYQNGTFSPVDSLNIRTLAEGCPVIQGSAVYMAEALFNVVYFEAELFTPICPEYIDKNAQILTNQSTLSTFTIYPVPNDGDFTLTGQITKGQTIKIKTMDGKVVYSLEIDENTEQQKIQTNLGSGIYFVLIEDETNHLLSQNKFIVTK